MESAFLVMVFSISHTASYTCFFIMQFSGDPYSMTSGPILKIFTFFRSRDAKLSNALLEVRNDQILAEYQGHLN